MSEQPDDKDVVIWQLPERENVDVYRVTKGARVIGEFTGRSVSSAVYRAALEEAEPGRAIWLKTDDGIRRLKPYDPLMERIPGLD